MKKVFIYILVLTSLSRYAVGQQDPIPGSYTSVKTEIIKTKGIKDESSLSVLNANEKIRSISYVDGFGRPLATMGIQTTPRGGDIIQLYAYDALGRMDTVFLPFSQSTNNGVMVPRNVLVSNQKSFYNNTLDKVADDNYPFRVNIYDNSSLSYLKEQGAPGTDWQPGNKTRRLTFRANVASEFRIWKADLTSPGYYAASSLSIVEHTDENGNKVISVADKAGKCLEKHTQAASNTWLKTLYIYDERGRIRFILQPEGVRLLGTATTISSNLLEDQAFQFVYDQDGRVVEKKVPGVAPLYCGYDPLGRLVLMQNGQLRSQHKWVYIKYDRNGRPIIQGLYTNTTQTTRISIQQNVLDGLSYATGETFYEKRLNGGDHGYSNSSFPTTDTEVLTVTYYDDHDLDGNSSADYPYTVQSLTGENSPYNPFGKVTATKVKVLNTASWITSYIFYNTNGQVIQVRANNHLSAALDNLTTFVYDFNGRTTVKKTYHATGGSNNVTVLNTYKHDKTGRLIQVLQRNNSDSEVEVASYQYNDLGQLVGKNLHGMNSQYIAPDGTIYAEDITRTQYTPAENKLVAHNSIRIIGTTATPYHVTASNTLYARTSTPSEKEAAESECYLQSIDYRYNIRGWLTSINNAQLTKDNTKNDDTKDLFGMEFLYNTAETGLNDQTGDERYWNGNISAMMWKGPGKASGLEGMRSYKYKYDKAGRLESAKFQAIGITTWSDELNALNELISYDHNGNIKTLQRNQRKHEWLGMEALYSAEQMDNLTYTYSGSGNLLIKVEDGSGNAAGFTNGANETTEYAYDLAGNMLKDKNKGINSDIIYNFLGKPQQITFGDGRVIDYTYDASGNKLKMVVTKTGTSTTSDYVDGFLYENSNLSFFGSHEGRVIKNTSGQWEYQYAIADHLGNTRLVVSSVTPAPSAPLATFEGDSGDQSSEYQVSTGFIVSSISANHTPGGNKVIRLNQTHKVGPSKSLSVFPGDAVDMEVWTYYEGTSGWGSTSTGMASWILSVAGAFGGSPTGTPEQQAIYNGVDNAITEFGMAGNKGDARPSAYLNYILFDRNHKLLDMGWEPVPENANFSKQRISIPTKNITEPGFIFVYLSYEAESNNWVYFDDLQVTHTKTNVIQYNEYYPFGLLTSASWTRQGHSNNFLYNSGSELNQNAGWYETSFRGYDAALGRFLQADPLAPITHSMSAYQYANCNPVSFNDPFGLLANPGFSDEVMQMIDAGWRATPEGQSRTFSSENGGLQSLIGSIQIFVPNPGGEGGGLMISYTLHDNGNLTASVYIVGGSKKPIFQQIIGQEAEFSAQDSDDNEKAEQGQSEGKGGFDWFVGAEGAATLGWENFAIEIKNVGGADYKRGARDWRISSNSKYGGSRPKSPNNATIDRTSVSDGFGATIQKNKDIVNGVEVFTESYTVGWEALGIQVNFDSNQNVTDVRFGIDSGVSIAIFGGLEVSLQMGGIYVFE